MSSLYFGFNSCHDKLYLSQLRDAKKLVQKHDIQVINDYEARFIETIGKGYGISIASGRMAFYLLLKHLSIAKGDEVIVVGFTCSVMINAILRVGATPIYSDVSPLTFGSDPKAIEGKISVNTKMIVAQHSFGIPCDIEEIVRLGKQHNLFVLEDCALAIGSTIGGVAVGNFGDAAIFSTDHSKPLNTLIGGFFYTTNKKLFNGIIPLVANIPELSPIHQKNLFKQLLFEQKWHSSKKYKFAKVFHYYAKVIKKLFGKKLLFMDGDNGPPDRIQPKYPYPAKLPCFLAQIGIYELERFESEKERRMAILNKHLEIFLNSKYKKNIQAVYFDKTISIVPLRFVFLSESTAELRSIRSKLSTFIDFSQIWFKRPIIGTNFDLEEMNYCNGDCPIAESIGRSIVNLPCLIPEHYEKEYFSLLNKNLQV